jgi:hypothetical protein
MIHFYGTKHIEVKTGSFSFPHRMLIIELAGKIVQDSILKWFNLQADTLNSFCNIFHY